MQISWKQIGAIIRRSTCKFLQTPLLLIWATGSRVAGAAVSGRHQLRRPASGESAEESRSDGHCEKLVQCRSGTSAIYPQRKGPFSRSIGLKVAQGRGLWRHGGSRIPNTPSSRSPPATRIQTK